jgi:choline dehydrogenase-like flavoprotein
MICDARTADMTHLLVFDLVIVGAGAAGIALALALRGTGLRTAVVEAGGERFSAEAQNDYAAARVAPATHSAGDMFRQRLLGGSTAIWGGRCIPFDPIDFAPRPWLARASWPIAYAEVARRLPEALRIAEAGQPEFAAGSALPDQAAPLIDGVHSANVVLDRIERFSKPSHFGKVWRDALARAADLVVYLHAPVTQVLTDDHARARGVRLAVAGRNVELAAPRVVLASGGIETARLLLASNEVRPAGLGNSRDLVGRFYQCHLEGEVGQLQFLAHPRDVRQDYHLSHDGIYCRRYIWLSPAAQQVQQLAGLVIRPGHPGIVDPRHRNPVLSAMYLVKNFIVPEYARKMTMLEHRIRAEFASNLGFYGAHGANMLRGAPRLALFGADWLRRRTLASRKLPSVVLTDPRGCYPADVNAEQEPNVISRITLAQTRDATGLPRVNIDWRATSADYERLERSLHCIAAAFAPSGTVRYDLSGIDAAALRDLIVPIGGHHIGTARMADTPADGVCDAKGEVFDTPGLFIAGAAAFPTSGFANPTLTLVALALRLAEHLAPGRTSTI